MRNLQRGLSLMGLIFGLFILIIVALFGMKVIPSFMEFRTAKNAIDAIARSTPGATPADVRRAFEARATIDDISAVKANDLEITKDGNQVVIGFAYRREVPLFSNVALCIDYKANTGGP